MANVFASPLTDDQISEFLTKKKKVVFSFNFFYRKNRYPALIRQWHDEDGNAFYTIERDSNAKPSVFPYTHFETPHAAFKWFEQQAGVTIDYN